jgi:hypothetical protein
VFVHQQRVLEAEGKYAVLDLANLFGRMCPRIPRIRLDPADRYRLYAPSRVTDQARRGIGIDQIELTCRRLAGIAPRSPPNGSWLNMISCRVAQPRTGCGDGTPRLARLAGCIYDGLAAQIGVRLANSRNHGQKTPLRRRPLPAAVRAWMKSACCKAQGTCRRDDMPVVLVDA